MGFLRRRAPFVLIIGGVIGGFAGWLWLTAHPFALRAPPDATKAFAWDTTPEIFRRGGCGPGDGPPSAIPERDALDPEWRPQPGRYVMTMLSADGPKRWRRIHGRLWLHSVESGSAVRGVPGPAMERLLYGATDIDLWRAFAPGVFVAASVPPERSTDPAAPGVVVSRDSAAHRIMMRVGSIEFNLVQGVGDGFAGTWRSVDSTAARGYFCAGWIEV